MCQPLYHCRIIVRFLSEVFGIVLLVALVEFATLAEAASADAVGDSLRQANSASNLQGLPADAELGAVIPDLEKDAIPQGLAYLPKSDCFLISLYREKPFHAAFLVAVEAAAEKRVVRRLALLEEDGSPHEGHVGGIAVDDRWAWIGSTPNVFRIPLDAATRDHQHDTIRMEKAFTPVCSASFVAFHDDTLWVGEFVDHSSPKYPGCKKPDMRDRRGEPVRAWLAGYTIGKGGTTTSAHGPLIPDKLFSIPEKTQGLAFHRDLVLVSTSYGRDKNSVLRSFVNPLKDAEASPHDTVHFGRKAVPLWFLDTPENPPWMPPTLPPLAEGIAVRNDMLAVLFESGARKYEGDASTKIDRLVYLHMVIGE